MKFRPVMLSLLATTLMSGCATVNTDTLMQSGAQAYQAYTLSDADVKTLSVQSCEEMDKKAQIAPDSSEYAQRLKKSRRHWVITSTARRPTTRCT